MEDNIPRKIKVAEMTLMALLGIYPNSRELKDLSVKLKQIEKDCREKLLSPDTNNMKKEMKDIEEWIQEVGNKFNEVGKQKSSFT